MKLSKLIFLLFLYGSAFAKSEVAIDELFVAANNAYIAEDYTLALEKYTVLEESGLNSTNLFYNLGNTHFRLGNTGLSIAYYEKALKLSPGNKDILHNLKLARVNTIDATESLPELFFVVWWKNLVLSLKINDWAKMAVALLWIGFLALGLSFFGKNLSPIRKPAYLIIFISLIFMMFSYSGFRQIYAKQYAIVISATSTIKSAPDKKSANIVKVHEGLKVEVQDTLSGWTKVQLEDGKTGWLPTETLFKI